MKPEIIGMLFLVVIVMNILTISLISKVIKLVGNILESVACECDCDCKPTSE